MDDGLLSRRAAHFLAEQRTLNNTRTALEFGLKLLTLVGQRMVIRLNRLDSDDSNERYVEVYLSVCQHDKKKRIRKRKSFPDD